VTNAVSRARRRPPLIVWAIAGAVAAGAYGHFALAMRFGPPLVMVALGGLTLILGAGALWRIVDPLTRAEVAAVPQARAPYRIRELEREKQAVLKAIKEIELDYQMRKISEADYREMVERYRARALRILSDLAAGDDYRALIERELKDRVAARAEAGAAGQAVAVGAADRAQSPGPSSPDAPTTPASGTCPACATLNDADAQFCKRCGQKLSPVVSP
jgi:hypothetical protein